MSSFPEKLTDRFRRFRHRHFVPNADHYEELATYGQSPEVMVLSCCDSRVDPETIFNAMPGELFVVRNVANLVPPYEPDGKLHGVSAALEFGVNVLKVKHVVVMGHASCGGVNAMLNGAPANCQDFVAPWVEQAAPSVRRAVETLPAEQVECAAEEAVVRLSLDNLRTFPWIAEKEAAGELKLSGLHFGIALGILSKLTGPGRFERLD